LKVVIVEVVVVSVRVDTTSLNDIISNDRSLITFFNVIGYYYYNSNCSKLFNIIARLWQVVLLLLAAVNYVLYFIGFCVDVSFWYTSGSHESYLQM